MSDPRYTDPRLSDPPMDDETRIERVNELERSSNAMWGWIAGGAVLALLLVFIFASGPDGTDTANVTPDRPAATTGMAPPRAPAETTGQGAPQSTPSPAPANPSSPPAGAR